MGPNEPLDPDRRPTESFAHPSEASDQSAADETARRDQTAPDQTTAPGGSPRSAGWFSGTRRTAIVAGVVGLVIGSVIGGSIGWAVTGNDDHDRRDSAYSTRIAPGQDGQMRGGQQRGGQNERGPRQRGNEQRGMRGVTVGTITAVNGSTWTVTTRNSATVSVVIGQNTEFGTPRSAQKQADFVVGDRIAIVGRDNSGTIDATRVAKRAARLGAPTPAPGATTQPG